MGNHVSGKIRIIRLIFILLIFTVKYSELTLTPPLFFNIKYLYFIIISIFVI